MLRNARDVYLETQINTATPQRLRLMLIDGAIRFSAQAIKHLEEERHEEASEALDRCRSIITELLINISPDTTQLASNIAEIYLFVFRTLTEAQFERDPSKLGEVLQVLREERETWHQICEKMPDARSAAPHQEKEVTAAGIEAIPTSPLQPARNNSSPSKAVPLSAIPPGAIPPSEIPPLPEGGFSLDA